MDIVNDKPKKSRWDARLPRPSSRTILSHGQLGRSNLRLEQGLLKRQRKGTSNNAHALGQNLNVRPSNGYKIVAVITAKMDELQRIIAYSDKQGYFSCPANFCGYRELVDDSTLGRAILWHAVQKEPWLKLVIDKWFPLLNRLHFGGRRHSGTPESQPTYSRCLEGTLAETADKLLFANVGDFGHDDRIYILNSVFQVKNPVPRSKKISAGKNIHDKDVLSIDSVTIDKTLEHMRIRGDKHNMDNLKTICKYRQILLPMNQARNEFYLSLRLNPNRYWKQQHGH